MGLTSRTSRGRPTQRRETRGEFGVARGRETGNKKTNEEREKKNKRRRDRRDEQARSTREGTDIYRSEPFADRGGRKQDEREQKGTETRRGRKTKRDEETKGEREQAEGKTKQGKTRHEGNKRTRARARRKNKGKREPTGGGRTETKGTERKNNDVTRETTPKRAIESPTCIFDGPKRTLVYTPRDGGTKPAGKRTKEKSKYDVTNGNNAETHNDVTCLHI